MFTKEEAFEELKSKLSKSGRTLHLSDRTIRDEIENLLPLLANDETELSDFVSKVLPGISSVNANMEKEKADFIKNYKPAETKSPKKEDSPTNVEDDSIAAIKQQLEQLQAQIQTEQRNKTIGSLKRSLKSKLKEKGVTDEDWIDTFIPELNITEDFDVDSKLDSYIKIYNKSKATTPPNVTPFNPQGGSNTNSEDLWQDLKK